MLARIRLGRLLVLFLLGVAASTVVAWGLALQTDPRGGYAESAATADSRSMWSVTRWTNAYSICVESYRERDRKRAWGTEQAIGPPDTPGFGDLQTAWASRTPDNQPEWLIVEFPTAVRPASVRVYETYNPGALVKVSVFGPAGEEVTAWEGRDPAADHTTNVADVAIDVDVLTQRVKLYLDSVAVAGWNEIDAIGLVDGDGNVQWASAVAASSSFADPGQGPGPAGSPETLVPSWCAELRRPSAEYTSGAVKTEQRCGVAFGWPLPALAGVFDYAAPAAKGWPSRSTAPLLRTRGGAPLGPLPYWPVWPGFLVNAVGYGAAWAAAGWLLTRPRRVVREMLRMRRGCCPRCGYDLRYDFASGCPECGLLREERMTNSE